MSDEDRSPTISVLMPVRNGIEYLAEAIDSVIAQTSSDWELIVVDNASSDGSGAYARQRAAADPRIRVVDNPIDIGISRSLNRGVEACRGELIARIDADDRALPTRLERQAAFLREHPEVIVLSCFAHYINPAGRRIAKAPHDLTSREAYDRYMAAGEVIGILHPGAMIRTTALIDAGLYRPEYEPAEDTDLWNRLSERGVVMVIPEYLMEYRLHSGSIVARRMEEGHQKREWVHASMTARRAGLPEPTWQETLDSWHRAPLPERLARRQRITVDNMLRQGRQELAASRPLHAYCRFVAAALLRPGYTAPRALRHFKPACYNGKRPPVAPSSLRSEAREA